MPTPPDDKRSRLIRRYVESLPEKIELLTTTRQRLAAGSVAASQEARSLAHKLVGSGASYGFPAITNAARLLELSGHDEFIAQLDALVATLRSIDDVRPPPATVLIVEDDLATAELIKHSLSHSCGPVYIAATAAAARSLLSELEFDLILLDLILPDGDGREILPWLRSHSLNANAPVIVLSACSGAAHQTECIQAGVHQFLDKPISPELLRASVDATLERYRKWVSSSLKDPLTTLWNRAGLQTELARCRSLGERSGLPLSLAMLDIDHFKQINDRYGHAAGDAALRNVANVLSERMRANDVVARWGGDEFAIMFTFATAVDAKAALYSARDLLAASTTEHNGRLLDRPTFSAGVVSFGHDEDLEEALGRADQLLYTAKAGGRDRIMDETEGDEVAPVNVLVIDDSPDAAAALGFTLEELGYQMTHAENGAIGVDMAQKVAYDLVLVDWQMPTMNGDAVIEKLRTLRSYRRTPIVMVTSVGDDDSIERAFELGADDYVLKPFRFRALIARIRRLMARTQRR